MMQTNILERHTHLNSSDFDGHTNFAQLSSDEKLAWLSSMARFLVESRAENWKN